MSNGNKKPAEQTGRTDSGERERTWFERNGGLIFGGFAAFMLILMIVAKRACG
jgi:hypothetical protein